MIFKQVQDGKPYPDHGMTMKQWTEIPPRPVRLDQLITTKRELALDRLLADDSTFYGDLFPHVVQWDGKLYLADQAGVAQATVAAPGPARLCWSSDGKSAVAGTQDGAVLCLGTDGKHQRKRNRGNWHLGYLR